jgi:hypothetical protein
VISKELEIVSGITSLALMNVSELAVRRQLTTLDLATICSYTDVNVALNFIVIRELVYMLVEETFLL